MAMIRVNKVDFICNLAPCAKYVFKFSALRILCIVEVITQCGVL